MIILGTAGLSFFLLTLFSNPEIIVGMVDMSRTIYHVLGAPRTSSLGEFEPDFGPCSSRNC